jgi:hypothetical protein
MAKPTAIPFLLSKTNSWLIDFDKPRVLNKFEFDFRAPTIGQMTLLVSTYKRTNNTLIQEK